jgi:hypothetical protein
MPTTPVNSPTGNPFPPKPKPIPADQPVRPPALLTPDEIEIARREWLKEQGADQA